MSSNFNFVEKLNEIAVTVLNLSQVDSTMNVAKQHFAGSSLLVIAKEQTLARGRQGRNWLAAEQGLYCTYIFPAKIKQNTPAFSLIAALTLIELLNSDLVLKWPNDILDQYGRKLAGVLLEATESSISIGIGLNLVGAPSQAVACSDLNIDLEINCFLFNLIVNLQKNYELFIENGFKFFKERWLKNSFVIGTQIKVRLDSQIVVAEFAGIADDGSLQIIYNSQKQSLYSAEIIG